MKFFWLNEETMEWQLCCTPAAKLMTLHLMPDGYHVNCLGQTLKLGKIKLKEAQHQAVLWLKAIILQIKIDLDTFQPPESIDELLCQNRT